MKKKYILFTGTWQPIREEDKLEIEKKIHEGHNVLICIENIEPDELKPLTAQETESEIKRIFWKYLSEEKIKTLIIPELEND